MEREIKFRVFDKGRKRMVYGAAVGWRDGKECLYVNWDDHDEREGDCPYCTSDKIDYVAMQYTGLKDKNGKEIYEGDIIFNPTWWYGPGEVFLNVGECGPSKGESAMSYLCRGKNGSVSHNLWNGKDVEVIGNIHENPDLLK